MTRVCVDARMVNNSGIGVYIRKYVQCLLDEKALEVLLIGREDELITHFGQLKKWIHIEANIPIYSIQEQIKLPQLIPACDVFWSPHYNIPILPIRAKKRLTTIPDVFHLAHLDTLSTAQKIYAKLVTNAAAHLSDKVLTISKFSEQEISKLTGISSNKITTIYLGLDTDFFRYIQSVHIQQQVRDRYQLPDQYILFVGNVKPNKNLPKLVDAFAKLVHVRPDIHLLIAGKKDGFITADHTVIDQIERDSLLANRIVFSGYISMNDLPVIYSMASVFAFPSLYEGFGFPPLEAMACRCPVVASDRASIPEVCGDAALYIDPTDENDLANGILRILTNQDCREKLVDIGSLKVQEYNWLHSQKQFLHEVYKLVDR